MTEEAEANLESQKSRVSCSKRGMWTDAMALKARHYNSTASLAVVAAAWSGPVVKGADKASDGGIRQHWEVFQAAAVLLVLLSE